VVILIIAWHFTSCALTVLAYAHSFTDSAAVVLQTSEQAARARTHAIYPALGATI
jgi:hypothetical protein